MDKPTQEGIDPFPGVNVGADIVGDTVQRSLK